MSPDIRGILPQVLNRLNKIYAAHARDGEDIQPGRIYVAPPDYHLLIEDGKTGLRTGQRKTVSALLWTRCFVRPLMLTAAG